MNARIQSLLNDLYTIDPTLREQEEQLVPLIEKLLQAKPDATPDPAFIERLRVLLQERALPSTSMSFFERLTSFFAMSRLAFGMGGVIAGVLLGFIVVPMLQPDVALREKSVRMEDATPPMIGIGKGGGGDAAISTIPMMAPAEPGMPPISSAYHFVFDGSLPPLPQGNVQVLKRERNTLSADTTKILTNLDVDLLDLATFEENAIDSINFIQNIPYGFTINVALREGMLSLYQNWEQWPHPETVCQGEVCSQTAEQSPEDVPSDDEAIAIAKAFVLEHGIDLTSYGPPQVDTSWRQQFADMPVHERSSFFIGDVIRVLYPFFIENAPVVDSSGAPIGITIGINIRERRVQEASGIMDRTYRSSAYGAKSEEDVRKILTASDTENALSISLGKPTLGYATISVFEENRMNDLLVPALIFPVERVPEDAYFSQSSFIVPLAKDLPERGAAGGGVMPMGR